MKRFLSLLFFLTTSIVVMASSDLLTASPSPPIFPNSYVYTYWFQVPSVDQYGESIGFYLWNTTDPSSSRQSTRDWYLPNITGIIADSMIWSTSTNAQYEYVNGTTGTVGCLNVNNWSPMLPPTIVSTNGTYVGQVSVDTLSGPVLTNMWNVTLGDGSLVQYFFDIDTDHLIKGWFYDIQQGFLVTSFKPMEIPLDWFDNQWNYACSDGGNIHALKEKQF